MPESAQPISAEKPNENPTNSGSFRNRGPEGLYTGRRKTAVARVKIKPGSGKIFINKKEMESYFSRKDLFYVVKQPLELCGVENQYDVFANVYGGGVRGQAEAIRLGLARALAINLPEKRAELRKAGFLTRDPRMVERKKYGFHKARRATQFSKR
ncbi:MAG: 30S ribosomal protein S9 [Leptospiraceae bacterium]|nr:30S ribosomal protein S9 [Leptospiraceae bacterium]MDW8306920.1 30S ribosomal protein S9 [Leptospiraceae bacterium]